MQLYKEYYTTFLLIFLFSQFGLNYFYQNRLSKTKLIADSDHCNSGLSRISHPTLSEMKKLSTKHRKQAPTY